MRRSLKTQQHVVRIHERVAYAVLPGPVDIPSPNALLAPVNSRFIRGARLARHYCLTGSGCPRNEDFPRKEVIQPQLPLRLPCYDFTPVTSPTFDGSLPCGLGHRLRVLLTPMV